VVIPAHIYQYAQAQTGTGFGEGDIDPQLARALAEIMNRHHSDQLAVRSSGVVEDTAESSYAGLYTTVLDVLGMDSLRTAVLRCWESAANVAFYHGEGAAEVPPVAVLVQRLLEPDAAGAAFALDPMGGGGVVSISAVRGRADKLMQGETGADEWTVTSGAATRVRNSYDAITHDQAVAIAELTRRISAHLSYPAEVEWALLDGEITVLQARPMTAVADRAVTWPVPTRGEWRRDIRLGEWLPEPVTPLFASWFLPAIDRRFRRAQWRRSGVLVPAPSYRLINGWYYHSPLGDRRSSVLLRGMLTHPGFACAMLAGRRWPWITNRVVVEKEIAILESHWSRSYDALVATFVATGFDTVPEQEVLSFVDRMIELVSDYIWPMILIGGAAWRAEYALARYYRRNILPYLNLPYHGLLVDQHPVDVVAPHAVSTLDWYRPTLGEMLTGSDPQPRLTSRTDETDGLEHRCLSILSQRNRGTARFHRLLTLTRDSARLRRQYTANLTRPWPILRQALHRLGTALESRGVIDRPEQLHFLTDQEVRDALSDRSPIRRQNLVADRTREWKHQCALRPPLTLGTAACLLPLLLTRPETESDLPSSDGVLRGIGVSPGRVTGRAHLVDHLARAEVAAGDVLVVRSFVPALAPLIRNAAAVVADQGSVAAHMSVIAREYGIPAVVGLHSVTDTVRAGDLITVDGTTGRVYPGGAAL
jgi:pyruvate,water dikinase